ncbi:MAG: C25 family cysteine peptidase [Promethearchaeota archaeon]
MTSRKSILLVIAILIIGCTVNFSIIENNTQMNDRKSTSLAISAANRTVDYLIITTQDFKSILKPLAEWKTQKGVISNIEIIGDIEIQYSGGSLPEKIKNCILDYRSNNKTQWVLLAGDHNHVPTKYITCNDGYSYDGDVVCCDSYYGDIDNDWTQLNFDYEAEIYIGRLTANNNFEMTNLVQRILNYEKNPPVGEWMSHAILAGAILQFDLDWNHDDAVDYGECDSNRFNHYVNKTLLPDNWTSTFLAQTQGIKGSDYHTDAELTYSNLKYAINQGCSIGTIFAHGNPLAMSICKWLTDYDGDMLFDYTANPFTGGGSMIDVNTWYHLFNSSTTDLIEGDKLGLYYFGSCSVGTFDYPVDCIAEFFLKNTAIGCVAGSYVVWGEDQWYEREHGGWFVDGLGYRFFEQLFQHNQPGKALALAKADYAFDRINLSDPKEYPEWGNKTLKQFNLLGDPEVPIWLSIPKQLNVSINQPYNNNTNEMILNVTANQKPVPGATVTYTENNQLIWMGKTNENGTIAVPFPDIELENKVFTISKNGFLPYQVGMPENDDRRGIPGYNIIGMMLIIINFIGIISIYYKYFLGKRKFN